MDIQWSPREIPIRSAPPYLARKLGNPARVRAMALEGEPAPCFENSRAERLSELAGAERDTAAEAGARQRIRQGRNLEPLA